LAATFAKPESYYQCCRRDLLDLVPPSFVPERVLDVGCAEGGNAPELRRMGAKVLVGVEIDHRAAAVAKQRFDRVIERSIEEGEALGLEPGSFSLIICADVLEHLVDPWSTLRYLRTLVAPDGYLLASIPNVRFYGVLLPLLFWGRFEYGVSGVLDITHLRFFTRPGIDAMLRQAGWLPARWSSDRLGLKHRLVNSLTLGLIRDFLVVQHYVLARPA